MRRRFHPLLVCAFAAVALACALAPGCKFFKRLAGKDTIMLDEHEVLSMAVDIRKEQKTICPLESVQMAVFVTVKDPEDPSQTLELETWQGSPGGRHNDTLDFANFAFNSGQGAIDEHGYLHPSGGVLATVAREFEIDIVLKKQPDKFSFKTTYKPDYRCVGGADYSGPAGMSGTMGSTGSSGMSGAYGGEGPGGNGTDGGWGGPGSDGQPGQPGQQVELWVGYVRTPFYDKLVAIRGQATSGPFFLLAHPEQVLSFAADGGPGGAGGGGGSGGMGGSGGSGQPGGSGGNGGNGGAGGNGAAGGNGGGIRLVFDQRFPDLRERFQLRADGGMGGAAGAGGAGGSGGSAGTGGTSGTRGSDGTPGQPGPNGAPGRVDIQAGQVAGQLADVPGIEPL